MLIKLRRQFYLALFFYALTLFQQYLFYFIKGLPYVPLPLGKYFGFMAFFFLLTFVKGDKTRYAFLSLIMALNFFQMAHLSFFGTQILPVEIYLLFTEFREIQGTLKEDLAHVLVPLFFTIVPLGLGWWYQRRSKPAFTHRAVTILVVLYFAYNPVRTYVTGNTWGRQPSTRELAGLNMYLTLSYFLGKILPHKLSTTSEGHVFNTSMQLKLWPGKDPAWDKIIVILGESLTPRHMQLYGYERPTTPFLSRKKGRPDFFHAVGLSGGVSTDVSVAYFLNLGFGAAGGIKAAKGEQCLFRLAKDKHFKTHFISIQSSDQLRYIAPYLCSSSLDHYLSLENVSPGTLDHQAARDRDLLKTLPDILDSDDKDFLMLHQRGSHSPWNLRSSPEAKLFAGPSNPSIDDYDNSVVEFDLFWKELDGILSRSQLKILVLYLSDHGESLGEHGRWGHGFLESVAFEIPVMLASYNRPLPEVLGRLPRNVTHYNLGLLLAGELGYEMNQKVEDLPTDYEVYGNDIDGFAGKSTIKFNQDGYTHQYSP